MLLLFYFTMVIYGLSLVGFGLLISSLCSTQQQAFIGIGKVADRVYPRQILQPLRHVFHR
jgi:uncharacterized protein YqfA (UPF0365 family)